MWTKTNSVIYAEIVVEGYHNFPGAAAYPYKRDQAEKDVSHLSSRHMHYFYIKAYVSVRHDDRDIEFIQFRRWLQSLYKTQPIEFGAMSCEMIADQIADDIIKAYAPRYVRVDVSEDNINGAFVEYQG